MNVERRVARGTAVVGASRIGAKLSWPWRLGLGILVVGLFWYALREVDLAGIWGVLRGLHPWQVVLMLALDAAIYALLGARWWLLVHADNRHAGLLEMIAVRLSAFGVSYFTVGPQIGGEPLQVLYLRRRYGSSLAKAGASVVLDKLLELLSNYVFLVLGLGALIQAGLLRSAGAPLTVSVVVIALLASWPLVHILLLRRNSLPLTAVLTRFPSLARPGSTLTRHVCTWERLVARFCRRKPRLLGLVLALSVLAGTLGVIEYGFVTSFLHIVLTPLEVMACWTVAWVSFLMPVPGGLGSLEASQVLALGRFGASAESAIGVSLLMRGRDVLLGGTGLLLGLHRWRPLKSKAL